MNKLIQCITKAEGSVIILFALMLPVCLLLVGGAIDFGRQRVAATSIQAATDAAALAGASITPHPSHQSTERVAAATRFFNVNIPAEIMESAAPVLKAVFHEDKVIVTTKSDMPTTLLTALGFKTLPIETKSVVPVSPTIRPDADVVLVINQGRSSGCTAGCASKSFGPANSGGSRTIDAMKRGQIASLKTSLISRVPTIQTCV